MMIEINMILISLVLLSVAFSIRYLLKENEKQQRINQDLIDQISELKTKNK